MPYFPMGSRGLPGLGLEAPTALVVWLSSAGGLAPAPTGPERLPCPLTYLPRGPVSARGPRSWGGTGGAAADPHRSGRGRGVLGAGVIEAPTPTVHHSHPHPSNQRLRVPRRKQAGVCRSRPAPVPGMGKPQLLGRVRSYPAHGQPAFQPPRPDSPGGVPPSLPGHQTPHTALWPAGWWASPPLVYGPGLGCSISLGRTLPSAPGSVPPTAHFLPARPVSRSGSHAEKRKARASPLLLPRKVPTEPRSRPTFPRGSI